MIHEAQYTNLNTWLNTRKPDYNTGLALLLSYSNKPALYAQLSEYKDVKLLSVVLKGLMNDAKEKITPTTAPQALNEPITEATEPSVVRVAGVPNDKVLQQLHNEWIDLLKQIGDLRQKYYFIGRDASTGKPKNKMTTDEKAQRKEIARLLVGKGGLNEQCLENRDAKRYYEEFGRLPERKRVELKPEERKVEGDVYLLKENARKLVGKLKGKIKKAGDKPNPDWLVNLAKAEDDLKFYQSKMDGSK